MLLPSEQCFLAKLQQNDNGNTKRIFLSTVTQTADACLIHRRERGYLWGGEHNEYTPCRDLWRELERAKVKRQSEFVRVQKQ